MSSPASELLGVALTGGWTVIERLKMLPSQTGACFSEGYVVVHDGGAKAFLKALDYSRALTSPDPARELEALTKGYNFERDLLARCRRMDRIVRALADGSVTVTTARGDEVVQYLVFELADSGDVRKYLDLSKRFDIAWALRSLHHMATGLRQLHSSGIAHQDLKPSNVLVFEGKVSKLADLGRASSRGESPPHETHEIAGDPDYAPPELAYHHVLPDWNERRLGCDAYLLGSMVVFFFGRSNMTAMILERLDPSLRPVAWHGSYADVLPYVREAFERALTLFSEDVDRAAPHLKDALTTMVRELCDPDPTLRGDPSERRPGGNQFSLERYVTRFDLLARQQEHRVMAI